MLRDAFFVFEWWLYILFIGILFLPVTQKYFPSFFDKGYGFSKVIGILALSYSSWLLGMHGILIPLALIPAAFFMYKSSDAPKAIKGSFRIMLLEELAFLAMLLFWSYVRGLQPDIYGLEKYMDFGFVNAVLRAEAMPPVDMWFAGRSINYYYFGHYICAYLIRLTGIDAAISYNLMIATLFSLSFLLTFSVASNLLYSLKSCSIGKIVLAGLIAASLLAFGGNLHSFLYGCGIVPSERGEYFYPHSTRYIGYDPPTNDKTIHEFPSYSFIVSDLHGHVSDIPAVLTFIALLLSCFTPEDKAGGLGIGRTVMLSLLLSAIYMTNTWDYPIYLTVLTIVMFFRHIHSNHKAPSGPVYPIIKALAVVLAAAVISQMLALPYSLKFEGISKGIGLVHYRTPPYQLAVLWGTSFFMYYALLYSLMPGAAKACQLFPICSVLFYAAAGWDCFLYPKLSM